MSNQPTESNTRPEPHPPLWHRVGNWLPRDREVLNRYISKLIDKVEEENQSFDQMDPAIIQFKKVVEGNPILRLGFTKMLQVPEDETPAGHKQIKDVDTLFKVLNHIIHHAIPYEDNELVGFPINAILDWPMATPAGLATLLMPVVNEQFKNIFAVWAKYLSSPASCEYLTTEDNGWFGPTASTHMPDFGATYKCDTSAPHYGFKSFDDFFTRQFQDGVRPVNFPDDNVITNACESNFYRYATGVKKVDTFWLKGQPYSLGEMLANDPYTDEFVDGTVYQAFLSAYRYHRWVSPVNGTIKRFVNIPGTYYAESPTQGFPHPDPAAPNNSQGYITAVATRAIVWIESVNPKIGLMGFMAVGMSEVSTCQVTVTEGQTVKKGDQLGMFHYGGSTHCLLFRKGVNLQFEGDVIVPNAQVLLNAPIAVVE